MSIRKSKSLFTGATKESFIHNPRQVTELQSLQTRYFKRLVKRKGKEGVADVLKDNMTIKLK